MEKDEHDFSLKELCGKRLLQKQIEVYSSEERKWLPCLVQKFNTSTFESTLFFAEDDTQEEMFEDVVVYKDFTFTTQAQDGIVRQPWRFPLSLSRCTTTINKRDTSKEFELVHQYVLDFPPRSFTFHPPAFPNARSLWSHLPSYSCTHSLTDFVGTLSRGVVVEQFFSSSFWGGKEFDQDLFPLDLLHVKLLLPTSSFMYDVILQCLQAQLDPKDTRFVNCGNQQDTDDHAAIKLVLSESWLFHCRTLVLHGISGALDRVAFSQVLVNLHAFQQQHKHEPISVVILTQEMETVSRFCDLLVTCNALLLLDVESFSMPSTMEVFHALCEELFVKHEMFPPHIPQKLVIWLVNRFERVDFNLDVFLQQVHFILLRGWTMPCPPPSFFLFIRMLTALAVWFSPHKCLTLGEQFALHKRLVTDVGHLVWQRELKPKLLLEPVDQLLQLHAELKELMSGSQRDAFDALLVNSRTHDDDDDHDDDTSVNKRFKQGAKKRRKLQFAQVQKASSRRSPLAHSFCEFVERMVLLKPSTSSLSYDDEVEELERHFSRSFDWAEVFLHHNNNNNNRDDDDNMPTESDDDWVQAGKLLRVLGDAKEVSLSAWFQAFCDTKNQDQNDELLARFVRVICNLRETGMWALEGNGFMAKKLFF